MLRLNNAIRNIDLSDSENALASAKKCITGVFILDLEKFIKVFDKELLNEDGGVGNLNLNRPQEDVKKEELKRLLESALLLGTWPAKSTS